MPLDACAQRLPMNVPAAAIPMRRRDDAVLARLIDTYSACGGLASPDAIVQLMRPHWRQPISVLARWIIGRRIVSVSWRSRLLLPVFQFEMPRMTPSRTVADCSLAFGDLVDDEGFAAWFIEPSERLGGLTPLTRLDADADAVVEAAGLAARAMRIRRSSTRRATRATESFGPCLA